MPTTSVIIALVIASLLAIAALIFMIIAITMKSSCENTENPICAKFVCWDPSNPTSQGTPAIRP